MRAGWWSLDMLVITKVALVILAGVYATRSSDIFFRPVPFQPLMVVAGLAFVFSIVLFYKAPTTSGWWQYTVIGLCIAGVGANAMLFFAPDASHNSPTQLAFSAVSMVGWAIVGLSAALLTMAPPAAAQNSPL
jgi:hypothetical protein